LTRHARPANAGQQQSAGTDWTTAPAPDQVEITLFGPGFGECALVHLGGEQWIIIDSCTNNQSHAPVALEYLSGIGVDAAASVRLVLVTHWHDDHISGLRDVVRACKSATFSCSQALRAEEFHSMVDLFNQRHSTRRSSGVREIRAVFDVLIDEDRPPVRMANANKPLLVLQPNETGHGFPSRVTALSPSDKMIATAMTDIAGLIPGVETKYRCVPPSQNHCTVVTHVEIGELALLLGGDLEDEADPELGWAAIFSSAERPQTRASAFKVPHHGAKNAHNDDVWAQMLTNEPRAILTPWNRGSKLPTEGDVVRICGLTPHAYATAGVRARRLQEHLPSAVVRQLREMGVRLYEAEPQTGAVRLRNGGKKNFSTWQVELLPPGRPLSQAHQ